MESIKHVVWQKMRICVEQMSSSGVTRAPLSLPGSLPASFSQMLSHRHLSLFGFRPPSCDEPNVQSVQQHLQQTGKKRSQTLKALMENFKLNVSQSFSESENRTDANRPSLSVFRDACGVFKFKAGLLFF